MSFLFFQTILIANEVMSYSLNITTKIQNTKENTKCKKIQKTNCMKVQIGVIR